MNAAHFIYIPVCILIGLVFGYWDTLRNHWDKWTRPASGAVAPGAFQAVLEGFPGGLKGVVQDEESPVAQMQRAVGPDGELEELVAEHPPLLPGGSSRRGGDLHCLQRRLATADAQGRAVAPTLEEELAVFDDGDAAELHARLRQIHAGGVRTHLTAKAAAGLHRLGQDDVGSPVPVEVMLPAPAQGAIVAAQLIGGTTRLVRLSERDARIVAGRLAGRA